MAKIKFNNTEYQIDDATLAPIAAPLKSHLSTVMNGTGAVINLGETSYNVDTTKLSMATNGFVAHLGTIAGNGTKVVVGGVEYSIDSTKVAGAVAELDTMFGNLQDGPGGSESYVAGLYQTGAVDLYEEQGAEAIEGMLVTPWNDLLTNGTITVNEGVASCADKTIAGDLLLPNDDSVTSIGNRAFEDCLSLTGIAISESVTSIKAFAFNRCSGLTSITIPDSVTSTGNDAFAYCSNLVYTEYGNTYYLGNKANPYVVLVKAKNKNITSCEINSATHLIQSGAFQSCKSLTSIVIPEGVTSIGSYAFEYCSSLKRIVIPDSVTSIGSNDFESSTGLAYNEYGNAYYLGNETNPYVVLVKAKNKNITSCEVNGATKFVRASAFAECSSITSITIPNSVTSIGDSAFSGCSKLTSIVIPDSVTSIYGYMFKNCTSLTSIVIPESVTSIGNSAFYKCSSLESVVFSENGQLTSIGENAFSDCSSLKSITIPDGVTSIGYSAFYGCTSLKSIVIPDSVTTIDTYAFSELSSLESVIFEGTKAQWNAMAYNAYNDWGSATHVICSDGQVAL